MGPNRVITNRRGYLTETVFDDVTGRFEERPWPPEPDDSDTTTASDAEADTALWRVAE